MCRKKREEFIMKKLSEIIATLLSLTFTSSVFAGTSEVKWTNPDDYRDVHAGEGHRAKFKERTFSHLEKHFAKLAEKLPAGQTLHIEVTDLDLAGDVNNGSMRQIRVIKDIHFPRIKFNYKVMAGEEVELSSGEVNLKDMGFLRTQALKYRNDALAYEKKMLDDWFSETF